MVFFFFQADDVIRDGHVTGVQTCALPISDQAARSPCARATSRDCVGGAPAHRGSLATSEMMTRSLRKAAVPQEPMSGPTVNGVMARVQAPGTRAPAAGHSRR